jgi:carbonic anhydrase/acetyltransferase-like protein (isoleucine patch superfamily)
MIRELGDKRPRIAESAYIDPEATIVGDVAVRADASIWPGAVLRADGGQIVVEEEANVQDNAVFHADAPDEETRLCLRATVGHGAVVHNAEVGERALVGMNAVVLDRAVLEDECVVAAGAVVTEAQTVESRQLVAGTPAKTVREDLPVDSDWFNSGEEYVELAGSYANKARCLDRNDVTE